MGGVNQLRSLLFSGQELKDRPPQVQCVGRSLVFVFGQEAENQLGKLGRQIGIDLPGVGRGKLDVLEEDLEW